MGKDKDKTNVMRVLDSKKIEYQSFSYTPDSTLTGEEIARILGEDVDRVFKTLVTQAKSGRYYVFVIPVSSELDLKKAAAAVKEKAVSMIKQKELLPLTGYVHGGCSPVGMKKQFPTVINSTAEQYEKIFVSAGRVGAQVEVPVSELSRLVGAAFADVISE